MKRTVFVISAFIIILPFLLNSCSSEDKVLPITDFSVQSQGNLVGENVYFFDLSKNEPVSWEWSFPGGTPSISTKQNPIVVYAIAGKYSVTLKSTNADGSNSVVKNDIVTILQYNSFIDSRDGKTYKSMKIGNDEWMIENLNYQSDSCSYVYAFLANYATIFGRVYDWPIAQTIAPQGWHLPTDIEFTALINYLGGNIVAGGKMKSGGSTLWSAPNAGATNISGFNALPAGGRYSGNFTNLYKSAFFWTSNNNGTKDAWSYAIDYDLTNISRNAEPKSTAMSVRCVKDK